MPIRFACEHCGARLSVSSRKAGARAKCPKCQESIAVPAREEDEQPSETEEGPGEPSSQQQDEDPFSQFLVYDDETELIYATEDEEEAPYAEDVPVDPTKVAVPRRILYMQGALLGVVAVVCFTLGVVVGLGTSGRDDSEDVAQPCLITGRIALENGGNAETPDRGAVAIVVPRNVHPDQKADIDGLRPQDVQPDESHPGLLALQSIGGDYARADEDGRFQLRVRDTGEYFVLVISANRIRSDEEQAKNVLAQIGRFFQLTPELFGGNDYRWQEETVRRDRELTFVF